MNIIKIRNLLLMVLLLTAVFYPVTALTRTISDSSDTYYTLIRNTKGNIWEPTGANLQAAINDIGTSGGTVYVGSDITLTNPLTLKNNCIVDFLGNTVTLQNNRPFVTISSSLSFSTVRNVNIIISSAQTQPVIYFYGPIGADIYVYSNNFENIYIKNPSGLNSNGEWIRHDYTGIAYLCEADNNVGSSFLNNRFENIHMEGPKIGILFANYGTIQDYPNIHQVTHYINGEYFKNIYIDQFETAVSFDVTHIRTCNQLVFNNFIAKAASFSRYGIMNISRSGIDFIGGVIDWHKARNPKALLSTDMQWDYRHDKYLTTCYAYINWCAPYDSKYMTDIATSIYYYNFLIANGKIQWTQP